MKVVALACLVLLAASSAARADSPAERIKERFVEAIGKNWQEGVQVCELRIRKDRREFLAKRMELAPKTIEQFKEYSYVVSKPFDEPGYDLTVLDMVLTPNADFEALQARRQMMSKILTRMMVLRRERRVLVVFTEKPMVPDVGKFMDELDSIPSEEIWQGTK